MIEAERLGAPFLVVRDGSETLVIEMLPKDGRRFSLGRRRENDLCLWWDEEVSRVHAELDRVGGEWTVADDGLSINGTYVNGSRIGSRRRLRDGDMLRLGGSLVMFRLPGQQSAEATTPAGDTPTKDSLSQMQQKVLVALCRPYRHKEFASPATNSQIAAEVHLSVDAVKDHLRALFAKLDVGDLPQNQKRMRLVERAFAWGLVAERDL